MTGLCTAGAGPDIYYHGQGPLVLLARQPLSTVGYVAYLITDHGSNYQYERIKISWCRAGKVGLGLILSLNVAF